VTDRSIGPEVVIDVDDVEGHRLAANDNETVPEDESADVAGHRLAANDNETVDSLRRVDAGDDTTVTSARRLAGDGEEEPAAPDAARRLRR